MYKPPSRTQHSNPILPQRNGQDRSLPPSPPRPPPVILNEVEDLSFRIFLPRFFFLVFLVFPLFPATHSMTACFLAAPPDEHQQNNKKQWGTPFGAPTVFLFNTEIYFEYFGNFFLIVRAAMPVKIRESAIDKTLDQSVRNGRG